MRAAMQFGVSSEHIMLAGWETRYKHYSLLRMQ